MIHFAGRVTYEEALQILNAKQNLIKDGDAFSPHHRQVLSDYFENYPIFVTHFPSHLKRFNVKTEDYKVRNSLRNFN